MYSITYLLLINYLLCCSVILKSSPANSHADLFCSIQLHTSTAELYCPLCASLQCFLCYFMFANVPFARRTITYIVSRQVLKGTQSLHRQRLLS